jgi:Ca-activated chloride channel family protein
MAAALEPVGTRAMTFTDRDLLFLIALLPVLVAVSMLRYVRRRRRVAAALGDARLLPRLGAAGLQQFPWLRFILLTCAAAVLGIAAAGPRWGISEGRTETRARSIVLAVDISKSMLARDVQPNRLERERVMARRILRELASDRIGLVVFAGRAYILSPLTSDHSALQLYVDALDPEMVSQGGSSVAAALSQAVDLARGPTGKAPGAAVVLMSDGEALEEQDEVMQAAERAARIGVAVHTVGFGTESGARIPDYTPGTRDVVGYKRDAYGNVVVSRLDERILRRVAEETGGQYFRADQPGAAAAIMGQLRSLQRSSTGAVERTERKDRTMWFVGLALLLLVIDHLMARRADTRQALAMSRLSPRLRGAAALLAFFLVGWGIGEIERGNRHYRAGRYTEAVRDYEAALKKGKDTPELRYNLGTALLQLGRFEEADQHLQLAVRGRNPELRQRAHFNTGFRRLVTGRRGGESAQQDLAGAIENYKHALRLKPEDLDAKWNLELALREQEKQKQQPQSGGSNDPQSQGSDADQQARGRSGGAGSTSAQGSAGQGQNQGSAMQQRPMSREQAERLLSAIEQDERELTREKLRKGQRRTAVARDW